MSSVIDPAGPVDLPPPTGVTLSFKLEQREGLPDMMLAITNTTKARIKFDTLMFVPDSATGGVHVAPTSACPLLPPQGNLTSFGGFEHWPHPIAMLVISNIRAVEASSSFVCN